MINKLKLVISDSKNIKLCDEDLSPTMKEFTNKLWFDYYKLFGDKCIKSKYHICFIPFKFMKLTNKYSFIDIIKILNKMSQQKIIKKKKSSVFLNRNNRLKLKSKIKILKKKELINKFLIEINYSIDDYKLISKYKYKDSLFIKYQYLLNKYNLLQNKINILVIIENNTFFGHLEALLYYKIYKKYKYNINILYFKNFKYTKNLGDRQININKNINFYSKRSKKNIIYDKNPNIDCIEYLNKYNLIIVDMSDWLVMSSEFLEYANQNIYFLNFLIALNKLNENGTLIMTMSLNTKFSCDIILLAKEYFNEIIFDTNYSINFMNKKIYPVDIIFKNFKKITKKDLIKLKKIWKKLYKLNPTSKQFNVKNIKLRKRYNILGNPTIRKNYKYAKSLLNIKSSSTEYDNIRNFNINLFKEKSKKIDYYINLVNKEYYKFIPLKFKQCQLQYSIEYLQNNKLNIIDTKNIISKKINYEDYPFMKYIDYFNILKIYNYILNFNPTFIYTGKNKLSFLNNLINTVYINNSNISSFKYENKYFDYWNKNKNKIIKYCKKEYKEVNNLNLSNSLYNLYNNSNLLYFEILIIGLIERYKINSLLDYYYTTPKRFIGSLIRDVDYTTVINNDKIGNELSTRYIFLKTQNKKFNIYKKYKNIKNKFNLVYVDCNSKKYNKPNMNKYLKYLTKDGILVYSYYKKITDKINEKYDYEIITFNTQILLVYFKDGNKNIYDKNKKKYLILNTSINYFAKYLPKDWSSVYHPNDNLEFVYIDNYYYKLYNNFNIKSTNIISKGIFSKETNFNDKSILHNFVKKDNPKIFKKYFLDQYDIINKNVDKYKYLFKKDKYWIVKPEPGGKGFGIKLFDNINNLKDYITNFKEKIQNKLKIKKWVLQKYITNPLLIKETQKKFNMRFIYLITKLSDKVRYYLFKEGFIYPSKVKFTLEQLSFDIHDSHTTATDDSEKKLFFEYFTKRFGKKKTDKIFDDIKEIFKYISSVIDFKCWGKEKCFHLIGADINITDDLQVKILELNMGPGGQTLMRNVFSKTFKIYQKELIDIVIYQKETNNFVELKIDDN